MSSRTSIIEPSSETLRWRDAKLGFLAVECGWIVTEVGRQPWIIYGIMRTADSSTPMAGLAVPLIAFTVLYLILAVIVVWLLIRHIQAIKR